MEHSSIAVLSTGAMGSAIARALLKRGHSVVVWNRTASKAQALCAYGAVQAESVEQAVSRCDVIIAVPNPYDALHEHLLTPRILPRLRGKRIVLLSSYQSLEQPQALQALINSAGASFVDGKIFCYPSQIGGEDTVLAFSGSSAAFELLTPLLTSLGRPLWLGERIELAFIYECAMTSLFVAMVGNVMNGAALMQQVNIPTHAYELGLNALLGNLRGYLNKVTSQMLPTRNFDTAEHGTASTAGILQVMQHFDATFEAFGVEPQLSRGVTPFMQALVDRGEGKLDLAALINVFADQHHQPG